MSVPSIQAMTRKGRTPHPLLVALIAMALWRRAAPLSQPRNQSPRPRGSVKQRQQRHQPIMQHQQRQDSSEERRQQSRQTNNPLLSLNLNLDALARSQAAERAQELYQRIAALHREGYYAVSPDVVSFNSVLKAWQSDPARALEFWEQEVDQLAKPNKPNVRSYNIFLLALAKAGLYQPAEKLLQQMQLANSAVVPDRISYNTVLLAFALSKEPTAAARADSLLREMLVSNTTTVDTVSFNTVIAAWSAHPEPKTAARKAEEWLRQLKAQPGLRPDVYSYTTVLQAWTRCAAPKAPHNKDKQNLEAATVASQRARQLLQEMQTAGLQPNRVTYTVVMQTLAAAGQPEQAHAVLEDMMLAPDNAEMRPDCVAFSALIDGYAQQAAIMPRTAVQHVQSLLQQMKDLGVAPNARTYTSVFSTLAHSRLWEAGPLAVQYLQEMRDSSVPPSVIHYNAALDVWAKSPRADKAQHAAKLWRDMQQAGVVADSITYNTLLACTAHVFGSDDLKREALRMGLQVFSDLQDHGRPNTLSYHYWFKTIRKLMPPNSAARLTVVQQAFALCCQQGCLNDMVLQYVKQHMVRTPQEFHALLAGVDNGETWSHNKDKPDITIVDLPATWSRHAFGPNRRKKNRSSRSTTTTTTPKRTTTQRRIDNTDKIM